MLLLLLYVIQGGASDCDRAQPMRRDESTDWNEGGRIQPIQVNQ
jgi:hypothetical protein